MSSTDIRVASLEGMEAKILREWAKYNPEIMLSNGTFTEDARAEVEAALREMENMSSLFNKSNVTIGDAFSTKSQSQRKEIMDALGVSSFEEAMELAASGLEEDIESIQKAADDLGLTFDQLSNRIFNLNPEYINTFANGLGMTRGDIMEHSWALRGVDLSLVTADLETINSRYEELGNILSDIVDDASIGMDNLQKVISSYPELMQTKDENGNISYSQDAILGNILDAIMLGEDSEARYLYGAALYRTANTDAGYFDMLRNTFTDQTTGKVDWTRLFGNHELTEEEQNLLNRDDLTMEMLQDSSLGDDISTEGWQEWKNLLAETVTDLGAIKVLEESIVEWQKHEFQTQIDNLESIKDNLDAINETREKELDLIKAKDKLENAKKEKNLVYRQGIGWAYESDQTAIQEAKQELDDLETQKEQEDIQYQIDQLQKLVDLLDNRDTEMQLRGFQDVFEQWSERVSTLLGGGSDSNGWLYQIWNYFDTNFQKEITEGIIQGMANSDIALQEQNEENAAVDLVDKYNKLIAAGNEVQRLEEEGYVGSETYQEAVKLYNQALSNYNSALDAAKAAGLEAGEVGDRLKSYNEKVASETPGYEDLSSVDTSNQNKIMEGLQGGSGEEAKDAGELKYALDIYGKGQLFGGLGGNYGVFGDINNREQTAVVNGEKGKTKYYVGAVFSKEKATITDDNIDDRILFDSFGEPENTLWLMQYMEKNKEDDTYKGQKWNSLAEKYNGQTTVPELLKELEVGTVLWNGKGGDRLWYIG